MAANRNIASAIIANGASLSGAFTLGGATVCGLLMPAAWTAAALTFQVSLDGVTFQDLYDKAGVQYQVTAGAGTYINLPSGDFNGMQYLKVRSGLSGAPVTQLAARTLQFVAVKSGDTR